MYDVVKNKGTTSVCKCPYCGHTVTFDTSMYEENMHLIGKHVVECLECERLFTIRDDGDSVFISTREFR